MRTYKNIKNGEIVETYGIVNGPDWKEVTQNFEEAEEEAEEPVAPAQNKRGKKKVNAE